MKLYRSLFFALFLIVLAGQPNQAQILYNGVGHIPVYYQERWDKAGLLRDMSSVEPKKVINVAVMPGATDSDKVDAAIDTAQNHVSNTQGLSIIYFPTGTYYLSSTIELAPNDSNIVFQGAGSDLTILEFQYIKDLDCFDIRGYAGDWFDLDQNFNKGDSIIHTPSGGLSSISREIGCTSFNISLTTILDRARNLKKISLVKSRDSKQKAPTPPVIGAKSRMWPT